MMTGDALTNRAFQLLVILTKYQILSYGRSYYVQGLFLGALLVSSGMVAVGVRSDWLASEVVTWGSLFVLLPVTLFLLIMLGSVAFVSSEYFIWNHVLARGMPRSVLFVSRSLALILVGQVFTICVLILLVLSSSVLASEGGRDIDFFGVIRWYLLLLTMSLFIAGIAGGVSASNAAPWLCVFCSIAAGSLAAYLVYFFVGFDFTLINLVDSIGELVRGGGSFAYGTTVLMIVISFIFQLAGNWRLTGRDF